MSHVCRVVVSPVLVVTLALAGCGGNSNPSAPTPNIPYSQADLRVGSGAEAVNGKLLTVHYTGWLYDQAQPDQKGRQFDTSIGTSPFSFRLGAAQVIAGWDRGLVGMKVGGQRRLVIPPALGYGSTGIGTIPPNATLVFDVELVSVAD